MWSSPGHVHGDWPAERYGKRGLGVLMRSSDLAELARQCDAALVFRRGGGTVTRMDGAPGLDEARLRAAIGA